MKIFGLTRFTLIDYPGKISAVVFTGHCNFCCPYCHNAVLVCDPESQTPMPESDFFDFLENRRGKLDGVVISGGEPTLQADLPDFAAKIKQLGFSVKIDTNGSNFDMIEKIYSAGNLDALGVDYKAPRAKYPQITGCLASTAASVVTVISFAVANNIKLDLRTMVHRSLLSGEDLRIMRRELNEIAPGVEWILQQFNPADILDEDLLTKPSYTDRELLDFATLLGKTRVRSVSGLLI